MPIDLIFNALLGLGFAFLARDRIRADGPFAYPAFPLVTIFAAIVVAPISVYLYLAHPAWSWMYLLDPDPLPALAVLPLVTLHGASVLSGWYLGARLIKAGRERQLLYGLAASSLLLLLAAVVSWRRLGSYGTYGEFHDGRALALMEVKLGYVLIGVMLGIAAAAGLTAVELMRDSRRVRTR